MEVVSALLMSREAPSLLLLEHGAEGLAGSTDSGPTVLMYQQQSIWHTLYNKAKALSRPIHSSLRDLLFHKSLFV